MYRYIHVYILTHIKKYFYPFLVKIIIIFREKGKGKGERGKGAREACNGMCPIMLFYVFYRREGINAFRQFP